MAKITANYFAACKDANKVGVCEYTVEGETPEEVVANLHAHELKDHAPQYQSLKPEEREQMKADVRKVVRQQTNPELRKQV